MAAKDALIFLLSNVMSLREIILPLTKIYLSKFANYLLHSLSFVANSFSLYGLIRSFQANERYSSLAFLTTLISVFSAKGRTGFYCEKRIR
jgi:hypothetical protein